MKPTTILKIFSLLNFALIRCLAADFPIDTNILIPAENYPTSEIAVRIIQIDTNLFFSTSPGTASCPGFATGDFKNVTKKATKENLNPSQNTPLWSATIQCGASPNSYAAYAKYYEYEISYRKTKLYLTVLKFIGPQNFQTGTFPPLNFQIEIDTISHLDQPMGLLLKGSHPEIIQAKRNSVDINGRIKRGSQGNHSPAFEFEVHHGEIKTHK